MNRRAFALVQSGLSDESSLESMDCCCQLRTVTPFEAEAAHKPINPKDEARTHQFGTKLFQAVFCGLLPEHGVVGKVVSLLRIGTTKNLDAISAIHIK